MCGGVESYTYHKEVSERAEGKTGEREYLETNKAIRNTPIYIASRYMSCQRRLTSQHGVVNALSDERETYWILHLNQLSLCSSPHILGVQP